MNTHSHITLAAALGLGILVSPDAFVLVGNFMGHAGSAGLWVLPATLLLYVFIARSRGGEIEETPLFLTVKIAAAVLLSTGILVSAGFVFNEVFLYWFPNFGFAFLLLSLVLGIQMAGQRVALRAQLFFTGIVLAALGTLIVAGLIGSGSRGGGSAVEMALLPGPGILGLPLLLWVGFDLAGSVQGRDVDRRSFTATVAVAGLVFFLWGLVSILHVPLEKLADTGVPHMKVARAVLGENGRILMGVAVISGTLAAVNALFLGSRQGVSEWAAGAGFPKWIGNKFLLPVLLALAVGLMMALGMAGSETLEFWIRAVFLLWLLGYVRWVGGGKGRLAAGIIIAGSGAIALLGEAPLLTLFYMGCILGAGLILGLIASKFLHHQNKRS